MKINIDLPDRIEKCRITIFAGVEMIAYKDPNSNEWEIVEKNCSRCGQCCSRQGPTWIFYDKEKGCKYLELAGKDTKCLLGAYRPFGCCCSVGELEDYCQIKRSVNK